jgi:pyruvate dehydrogenase kinase 2/3/4
MRRRLGTDAALAPAATAAGAFHPAGEASMQSAFSSPWESGHDRHGPSCNERGSAAPPRSARSLTGEDALLDRIHHLAQYKQRPVTLQQLLEIGRNPSRDALLEEAKFLYQELPVRLSHRVVELEKLPFGLAVMPSVRTVHRMYVESLRELISASRPEDEEGGRRYVALLDGIKRRHDHVILLMAQGVLELKQSEGAGDVRPEVHEFLDRFFLSRIGIRMLIGQHVALHDAPREGFAGLICERCRPAGVAREAALAARNLCYFRYGVAPEVRVLGNIHLAFPYVPSHLRRTLIELLKNSMRAVVEFHGPSSERLPPIGLILAEGNEDVTIKVSDEGGGIPRSGLPQIWTYLYTTAVPPSLDILDSPYARDYQAPFAGLGFGLPISRLHARYFGGELQVISMEGYGTDAYLHLKRLGDGRESLPRKLC